MLKALIVFFFFAGLFEAATAQTESKNIVLLNSSGNSVTLGMPAVVTNNTILLPGTLGLQGAIPYISSVAGSVGTTTWLNPGTNGFVLTLAAGIPSWSNLASVDWQLNGNSIAAAYNGTTGSFLGTTNTQPLVLGTTNTGTAQPIEFFTTNTEKMRLAATGELGIGLTPTAGKLLHVNGTSGTSNVRLASLASATGTTGRVMFATDATGDLETLAVPGTSGFVLTSTTAGVLSWVGSLSPTLTNNHIFVGNASNVATDVAMSGDVAIVASGATTIQPASVTLAKMANLAANSIIGNNTGALATPIALTAAQTKTLLSLNNVENTALSTWPGSSNIITLGTITTGTWTGTSIAIANGGTGQTTAANAFKALSPLTTLGDLIYEDATPTPVRLAGNTTGTKKFLTQTGTGIISAAPGWNTIAAADVPVMIASGVTHAAGIAPDPGAVSGTTRFLREDATWAVPSAGSNWLLGGNSAPASNIFGTTSATNVVMQANSTQTLQLTGVATANYDVGSALFGTTATPIVSTGDKIVINGGNFSLNSETNGTITREIVFRGTAGSGNLRIRGDGNDLYWQGGGGKNLQMGAYWQINLLGQLQTAALQALSSSTTFAHVYIPLQQSGDPGLVIQNASGQTSDPFQIQAFNATPGSGSILLKVTSAGNMLLGASGAQLQMQGTSTGISTFQAGAEGATNINYTLPTTTPAANQVLTATSVAAPAVTLGWATPGNGINMVGGNTGGNSANNDFFQLGGSGQNAAESATQIVITRSATLQNLYVNLSAAPGGATSKTITVRKNGVNTALAVTVAGAATTGNNTANSISVAAGDLLSVQVTHAGVVAASTVMIGFEIGM